MFCKKCGAELQPGSRFCGNCGSDQNPADVVSDMGTYNRPSSYLALAIIVTILCCLPMGIVSIVYSSKVDPAFQAGDYEYAFECSKKAKSWALWGIALSFVFYLIYFVLVGIGVLSELWFMDGMDYII